MSKYGVLLISGKRTHQEMYAAAFAAHPLCHLVAVSDDKDISEYRLGLNRAQFGSLATSSAIAWWSSTMLAGYLGDRFSNRAGLMLAISLSLMGGSLFLVGLAPNYKIMLLVMFLAGMRLAGLKSSPVK